MAQVLSWVGLISSWRYEVKRQFNTQTPVLPHLALITLMTLIPATLPWQRFKEVRTVTSLMSLCYALILNNKTKENAWEAELLAIEEDNYKTAYHNASIDLFKTQAEEDIQNEQQRKKLERQQKLQQLQQKQKPFSFNRILQPFAAKKPVPVLSGKGDYGDDYHADYSDSFNGSSDSKAPRYFSYDEPEDCNNELNDLNGLTQDPSEDLLRTLSRAGIRGAEIVETIKAPAFTRIKVKPPMGVGFDKFKKLGADLQIHCGLDSEPFITAQAGGVAIDFPRQDREFCPYYQYANHLNKNVEAFTIPIGVNINNQLVQASLANADSPHVLVGGITGSGKTEWMVAAICSLIARFSPAMCQIYLIDPKQVGFAKFQNYPHVKIIDSQEEALEQLTVLNAEMRRRYSLLKKHEVMDINAYNKLPSVQKLCRVVVFFDEFAAFMDDEYSSDFTAQLRQLLAQGRGAGLHFILGTQRPDASVVSPLIRSNCPVRVALKTKSFQDGKIIIGNDCPSHSLLGKGDLYYSCTGTDQRLQGLWVEDVYHLLGKPEKKVITNQSSPNPAVKPSPKYGQMGEGFSEASSEPNKLDILEPPKDENASTVNSPGSIEITVERSNFLVKLLGSRLFDDRVKPLCDTEHGLSVEEKLHLLRYILYKNMGKESAIQLLWGVKSGGKYHDRYKPYADCFEQMKSMLESRGYSALNDWGFG